jgi:nucleoside-diphosphate-sugar epimerase
LDGEFDSVLVTASPGFRRGGKGNGLLQGLKLLSRFQPRARLLYTGSTAVYTDTAGERIDETGPLADSADPRIAGLLAIEAAVTAHPASNLVLRVGAIIGRSRLRSRKRVEQGSVAIDGGPDRAFPCIDEEDLALACAGLALAPETGIWNAVDPIDCSAGDYYRAVAQGIGVSVTCTDSGKPFPSRRIEATALWEFMGPDYSWRGLSGVDGS